VNKNAEFFINSYEPGIAAVGIDERERERERETNAVVTSACGLLTLLIINWYIKRVSIIKNYENK